MSAKKRVIVYLTGVLTLLSFITSGGATLKTPDETYSQTKSETYTWAYTTLAEQLGWKLSNENNCGGYYLEAPFIYPLTLDQRPTVEITSNHGLVAQHGTSFLEDEVTVNRAGQQITANKAYLYRDENDKLSTIHMLGDVHLREPNTLIVAKSGRYYFKTQAKTLQDIVYRTGLAANNRDIVGHKLPQSETKRERKITTLTAWGSASQFSQNQPKVYELDSATFSTCPPTNPAWHLQGSRIVLNKNTGRGYATHARLYVKQIPIFYLPYWNFSIDNQRKTGFLKPTIGSSGKWGPYVLLPFYWNLAPNYDLTLTPGILTKRGLQLTENFRYLSHYGKGNFNLSLLPYDREFSSFKNEMQEKYQDATDPIVQAELIRLQNSKNFRKALFWRDEFQYNKHWSSNIDFNYAGDDYYLTNFGSNLNEITKNQLLQQAELFYKSEHWNFTGRLQSYQTLHPIDQPNVLNQYHRVPQLILNADYPDQFLGLEYFINNEATNFSILKTPGSNLELPVGDRVHTQPGISLPIFRPYFYFNPRAQMALTSYHLRETKATYTQPTIQRAVPIIDLSSGLLLTRSLSLFHHAFQQTLEPQIYYLYVPYRKQSNIPIFDTTVNTLTYEQLFNYNRFSGLDRIGDANQLSYGVTSRFIDQQSGFEKIRFGIGEIIYFANRLVTLCNVDSPIPCSDTPNNHSNYQRLSPISGILNYYVDPLWSLNSNAIWNPVSKQLANATLTLHYQRGYSNILNFSYTYARGGDILSGIETNNARDNLKITDLSLAWPLIADISAMGRWSQIWNYGRLQNLFFGLQYDTCCWAVRAVGGRAFVNLDPNNKYKPTYANEFYVQFALKGLGNVGSNPSGLLSSITGYNPQFGQEF